MPIPRLTPGALRKAILILLALAALLFLVREYFRPETWSRPARTAAQLDSPAGLTRRLGPALEPAPAPVDPDPGLPDAYRVSPQALEGYRLLVKEAARESTAGRPVLVVDKAAHSLDLWRDGTLAMSWPVELGANPVDDKLMEGDTATPEGRYVVQAFKDKGQTSFYRALLLDYPNEQDLDRFRDLRQQGLIPSSATPGSLIEIHGHGSGLGRRGFDWTLGCIALSDGDMDALIDAGVGKGTVVYIVRYGARENYGAVFPPRDAR